MGLHSATWLWEGVPLPFSRKVFYQGNLSLDFDARGQLKFP